MSSLDLFHLLRVSLFNNVENDQTFFKNLSVLTTQEFKGTLGYFSTLCMTVLIQCK